MGRSLVMGAKRKLANVIVAKVIVATVVLLVATASAVGDARASPCHVPQLDVVGLAKVAKRLSRPPAWSPPPSSLWVLVPRRIGWTGRQTQTDGMGWYVGHTTGSWSERGLNGAARGMAITVQWDLAPLWRQTPRRPPDVAHLVQAEKLLARLAIYARRLAAASVQARSMLANDPGCARLQVKVAVDAQVLAALSGSSGVVRPAATAAARREVPRATSRSKSRRVARRVRRTARPARPGRGRQR